MPFDQDSGVDFLTAVSLLVTNMIIDTGQERVASYMGSKDVRDENVCPRIEIQTKVLRVAGLLPLPLDSYTSRRQTSEQAAGFVISLVIKLAIGKTSLLRRDSSEQVPPLDCTLTRVTHRDFRHLTFRLAGHD